MEFETQETNEKFEVATEEFRQMVKDFYLNSHRDPKVSCLVKNRRYKKLQEVRIFFFFLKINSKQLIDSGEYFSEERIKFRDVITLIIASNTNRKQPVLYFLYIGRYKRDGIPENCTFFDLLTQQMMNKEYEAVLKEEWLINYGKQFDQVFYYLKNVSKIFFFF